MLISLPNLKYLFTSFIYWQIINPLRATGEPRPTKASLAVWDADGIACQRRRRFICGCLVHHTSTNATELNAFLSFFSNLSLSRVSHLYVLQGGLAQQQWRVPELLHRLLQYLEPKLTQVYKNVRERIGRYVRKPIKLSFYNDIISAWSICSSRSSQCAHLHLHARREPTAHTAHHVPSHRRVHRARAGSTQAADGGRGRDPEPRDGGEHRRGPRWEDASHQATQNRCVSKHVYACVRRTFGIFTNSLF